MRHTTSMNMAATKAPEATARLTIGDSLVETVRKTTVPTPNTAKTTANRSACFGFSAPNLPGSLMGTA